MSTPRPWAVATLLVALLQSPGGAQPGPSQHPPPPGPSAPPDTSVVAGITPPPVVVVAVIYRIKAGHEQEALADLRALTQATRQERGNVVYTAHRSLTDPRQFLLYEQYESPAAVAAHRASAAYKRYAAGGLQTIAESRTTGEFTPLPPE